MVGSSSAPSSTFVIWGLANVAHRPGGPGNFGRINGETIRPTGLDAQREVPDALFSSGGSWPDKGRMPAGSRRATEIYYRLLMIQKQAEMGVHYQRRGGGQGGQRTAIALDEPWQSRVARSFTPRCSPPRLEHGRFPNYLRHELASNSWPPCWVCGGELVTPQEVHALYERGNQELQVQAAFFPPPTTSPPSRPRPTRSLSSTPTRCPVTVSPERMQVNYAKYPSRTSWPRRCKKINETTNLNEILEANVSAARRHELLHRRKIPAEARETILKEEQEKLALELARKQAVDFATMLYTNEPMRPENLITLAKANGLYPAGHTTLQQRRTADGPGCGPILSAPPLP